MRFRRSTRPSDLSVVARQCIAALCVQRFCALYEIRHPAIDDFVEHLWGVATVMSENFTEWAEGFAALPASTWGDDLPGNVVAAIPLLFALTTRSSRMLLSSAVR
jgi:hypothetical protein